MTNENRHHELESKQNFVLHIHLSRSLEVNRKQKEG